MGVRRYPRRDRIEPAPEPLDSRAPRPTNRSRRPERRRRSARDGGLLGALREPLCDRLELAESGLFLPEVRLQQRDDLGLAQRLRAGDEARVGRDLVVLGAGTGSGQEQVTDLGRRLFVLHELVVLGLDAVDRRTLFRRRLLAELRERLLDILDVLLRFLEVGLEAGAELVVAGLVGQLRQRLHEHVLGVQQIAELVEEQVTGIGHLGHRCLLVGGDRVGFPIAPRPNDYHPDHRYTGVLVQDAAYMVAVPDIVPGTPALKKNPVFLYSQDFFQRPNPFRPDIAVDITKVFSQKVHALDAHVSQVYEWLPWIGHYSQEVPAKNNEKEKWLATRVSYKITPEVRKSLERWYGTEKAATIQQAEAFEICEYGMQPDEKEIKRLFPMLGN